MLPFVLNNIDYYLIICYYMTMHKLKGGIYMDFKKLAFDKIKDIAEDKLDDFKLGDYNIGEIINDNFISKFTDFDSVVDFVQNSGLNLDKIEDLTNLPLDNVDGIVKKVTQFDDLQGMLKKASSEFLKSKVGL
jgi:hypothetical protein